MKNLFDSIRFMLLSTFFFALMNAVIKELNYYSSFQLVFFRSIGSLAFTTLYLKVKNISFWGKKMNLLIYRGLAGVISMTLFFTSVQYISVGSAVTLRYVAPLFAAVLVVIFLKEKIFPLQWLFFIIAFFGVVLIKGFDSSVSIFGVSLAIGAAFFSSIVYILISKIGHQDHPVIVVHYFMLIATLVGGIGSLFNWTIPLRLMDWVLLFSLGILGYFGQLYMTKAFQFGQAYMVAPFKYVEVIFTLSLGFFYFQEVYTLFSLLGTALVIVSLSINVVYKSMKKENKF
ncbi:MAG: DMT family transporter [Flavobacteriaceae bacterium]|nr:DMT family transporter [Flavobacteriaceae bacterium]